MQGFALLAKPLVILPVIAVTIGTSFVLAMWRNEGFYVLLLKLKEIPFAGVVGIGKYVLQIHPAGLVYHRPAIPALGRGKHRMAPEKETG